MVGPDSYCASHITQHGSIVSPLSARRRPSLPALSFCTTSGHARAISRSACWTPAKGAQAKAGNLTHVSGRHRTSHDTAACPGARLGDRRRRHGGLLERCLAGDYLERSQTRRRGATVVVAASRLVRTRSEVRHPGGFPITRGEDALDKSVPTGDRIWGSLVSRRNVSSSFSREVSTTLPVRVPVFT